MISIKEPTINFGHIAAPNSKDSNLGGLVPKEYDSQVRDAMSLVQNVPHLRTPTLFYDLDLIEKQFRTLQEKFPGFKLHYAMKCSSAKPIIERLNKIGCYFDAATAGEIAKAQKWGVDPSKVIVTKPDRKVEDLLAITAYKPKILVIQSPSDLDALAKVNIPRADYQPDIVLRLAIPFDEGLSGKFGVNIATLKRDLKDKQHFQLNLDVVKTVCDKIKQLQQERGYNYGTFGFSSHPGTNCCQADRYAVEAEIFKRAKEVADDNGVTATIFDYGGGLPDAEEPKDHSKTQSQVFSEIATVLTHESTKASSVIKILEPGRSLVANTGIVITRITNVGRNASGAKFASIDDSLYLDFLRRFHEGEFKFDDAKKAWMLYLKESKFIPVRVSEDSSTFSSKPVTTKLNGATCDSIDIVGIPQLPKDIRKGDYISIPNMGAYVYNLRITFNDLPHPQTCFYWRNERGELEYLLEDPEPLTHEDFSRLVEEVFANKSVPVDSNTMHTLFSGLTGADRLNLSRIMTGGSLAGFVDSAILRPQDVTTVNKEFRPRELAKQLSETLDIQVQDNARVIEGGMGWVIQVYEPKLARNLALKIAKFPADGALGQRFNQEAANTANLPKDSSIPTIYKYGIIEGANLPYYLMEFIEGKTFEADIKARHDIWAGAQDSADWRSGSRSAMLKLILQASQAISKAHGAGVIHRDIKPLNLMVPSDHAKPIAVLDWGLFKSSQKNDDMTSAPSSVGFMGQTRVGAVVGTVDYMSPEQARGEAVTEATDIWALGATIYRAVCNKTPLEYCGNEEARLNTLRGNLKENSIIPPSKLVNNVPLELEAIIMKALKVNPKERYQSAEEFAKDLNNFLETRSVEAYQERLGAAKAQLYSLKRWAGNKKRELALYGAMILGITGGAFGWNKHESNKAQEIAVQKEVANTKQTASDRLKSARETAEKGRLDEAIALLSPELIEKLGSDSSLDPLRQEIIKQQQDWSTFKHFKDEIFKVYSGIMNSFEFGENAEPDIDKLREISKIYLPEGLTEEGIEALGKRLDSLSLTTEQRLEVGDGLVETMVLKTFNDGSKIFFSYDSKTQAECAPFLEQIRLIESLCTIIESGTQKSGGWIEATEMMKRCIFGVLGDNNSFNATYSRGANAKNPRASGQFLSGIRNLLKQEISGDELKASLQQLSNSLLIDPNHIGARYFYTDALWLYSQAAKNEIERRGRLDRLMSEFSEYSQIDPNNPYLFGRLALVCQMAWDLDRQVPREERVSGLCVSLGEPSARKTVELCEKNNIKIPASIWAAYGEFLSTKNKFADAIKALNRAVELEPENLRFYISCASAKAAAYEPMDAYNTLIMLEKARNLDDPSARLLPEVASVYCAFAVIAEKEGNSSKAKEYKNLALDTLEAAVSKIPAYAEVIMRLKNIYYSALTSEPRFQELTQS